MAAFSRFFDIRQAQRHVGASAWFGELLRAWSPAGHAAETDVVADRADGRDGTRKLRLAVRAGYLNMYRYGQSVARVEAGTKGLRAKIHHKYLGQPFSTGGLYVSLGRNDLVDGGNGVESGTGAVDLSRWIENAERHAHAEKRFVDDVVAFNPNVVDLEMALPAEIGTLAGPRAPRMDLVALEPCDGPVGWRIVFWEAKTAGDGRVRRRGAGIPKVVDQLAGYTEWLQRDENVELVAQAYRNACRTMVGLHDLAKTFDAAIPSLGNGIRALAEPSLVLPSVDPAPRLLIDARRSSGEASSARGRSFVGNGHRRKLEDAGIHVQMVEDADGMGLDAVA